MRSLKFDGRYRELILSGRKRATVRIGRINLRPGDEVLIHSGGYVLGKATIKGVEGKSIGELTDEDARMDGFRNREELINALKSHYKSIKPDTKVTIVQFELKEKFDREILSSDFPYEGNNPAEIAELALKHLNLPDDDRKLLELFLRAGSLRKAAYRLGGLSRRYIIREVLRKAYEELKRKGVIGPKL